MKNSLFQDARGDWSSKRVFGAAIIVYTMIQSTFDGLASYNLNETIIVAQYAIGAALLGLDSVVGIWKQPKRDHHDNDDNVEIDETTLIN